ncbi:lytic polysaccharide monooxygenase [Peniophora sp. CONT]|nr:lytic polysaccharide monooxygenase [Peniophora sp. CONT]
MRSATLALAAFLSTAAAHYTFPAFIYEGKTTGDWSDIRMTNNHNSLGPVTDVTSSDLRCYTSATNATASTLNVQAGKDINFQVGNGLTIYHAGVVNVYFAAVPSGSDAASFAGDGDVWFKVFEIPAVTDGGSSISFPAQNVPSVNFTIPAALPSGQYLVRMEAIALHVASTFGGAQFYISCGQIDVTNGGSGTPGPKVAIPGVYTGNEPGILIDIYYPIPKTYTQPGPPTHNACPFKQSSFPCTFRKPTHVPPHTLLNIAKLMKLHAEWYFMGSADIRWSYTKHAAVGVMHNGNL